MFYASMVIGTGVGPGGFRTSATRITGSPAFSFSELNTIIVFFFRGAKLHSKCSMLTDPVALVTQNRL